MVTAPAPPLGVYIHWPFCARICPYCDFNVYRARRGAGEVDDLVAAVERDLVAQRRMTGPRTLVSIFFGGGTPSLMPPAGVARLIEVCRSLWTPDDAVEVSLEANPTDAETQKFQDLAAAGVNRLSLGLQSLDEAELVFLGRNHGADEGWRAAVTASAAFSRVSVDLIYALPDQRPEAWQKTLGRIADLGVEHVSPYQLTIEAGTAFDRAAGRGRFTPLDPDRAAGLFELTDQVLSGFGFDAYEVSNHARGEAARARHNLVYWRGEDYVGAGPGAHGRRAANGRRTATLAEAKPADYVARTLKDGTGFCAVETLSAQEAAQERLLMGLRIDAGVAFEDLAALGLGPDQEKVRDLMGLGLVRVEAGRLAATRAGRAILDAITRKLISL